MKKIIIFAILLILISCTGYALYFLDSNPHIHSDNSYAGSVSSEYTFPFKYSSITLSILVPASTYHGAKNSASKYLPWTKLDGFTYYTYLTNDPLQEEMYAQILDQTETVKRSLDLTDDEYVELLSTFVQSIDYETKVDFRYPVETIVDKYGDCDDKSTLLAGLLTRADYDAVLLVFEEESHATVGIKTTDTTAYPNTGGYAVIETTGYSYVTDRSFKFENGSSLRSTPTVINVGIGTKTYNSGYQVTAILDYRDKAESKIEGVEGTIAQHETRLSSLESSMNTALAEYNSYIDQANSIVSQQKKLNSDLDANKITYAEYSSAWDSLRSKYTDAARKSDAAWKEYQSYFSKYTNSYNDYSNTVSKENRYVDIYNLIISEPYNRQYVYQTVMSAK